MTILRPPPLAPTGAGNTFASCSGSLEESPFAPQNIGRLDISYKFSLISCLCSRNRLLNVEPRLDRNRSGLAAEANDRQFNRAVRTYTTCLASPVVRLIMASYKPSHIPPPGLQPYGAYPTDTIQQPAYYPGPSVPYAPSQLPKEVNEAGYASPSWGDRKENMEYGAPMEIKKKRINDPFFLAVFILQVSRMLFVAAKSNHISLQSAPRIRCCERHCTA